MNPSDFSLTDRITKVTSAASNVQNQVESQVNRVTNTVENVQKGVTDGINTVTNAYDKAGETYNKVTEGASSLFSKVGNLFGGSDIASTGGTKTAGSAASGASPGNKIAGFATDPTKVLPSLDPLKREVAEPFKAANSAAKGVLGYLQPSKISSLLGEGYSSLLSLRDKGLAAVGTDYASVKARLEQTMNVAGQIAKLPGQVQSEINGYVNDFNSAKYQVTAMIDDTKQTFSSFKDLDDYLAIDNFISSFRNKTDDAGGYTSTFSTLDIGTSSALVYGISSSLATYGGAQAAKVETLVTAITDPVAQKALWRELTLQASAIGNLSTVETYAAKLDAADRASISAETIVNLLMNLQQETGTSYKDLGTRLLNLFNLFDTRWDKSSVVNQTERTELYPYTFCNTNSIQALLLSDKRRYVCAAGTLSYDRADTIVNEFFSVA